MRGDRDNSGDSLYDWPVVLTHTLTAYQDIIARQVADARVKNSARRLDLEDAIAAVASARALLAQRPEGAELALRVLAVLQHLLRADAQLGRRHYSAAHKGATAPKPKARRRATRTHAAVRREARALTKKRPNLNTSAQAKLLARTFPLSEHTIRGILGRRKS